MSQVIIYQPTKSAMQSGKGTSLLWHLEYELENRRTIDPLMGWTSSSDMKQELCLTFDSKEAAITFAEKEGMSYRLVEPHVRRKKIRSYAENFTQIPVTKPFI